jgi:post-segregation antitoxin (ccd killing protein)
MVSRRRVRKRRSGSKIGEKYRWNKDGEVELWDDSVRELVDRRIWCSEEVRQRAYMNFAQVARVYKVEIGIVVEVAFEIGKQASRADWWNKENFEIVLKDVMIKKEMERVMKGGRDEL